MNKPIKAVVMGGGTGTFPVIAALKHMGADITTVICVSDSGGSTGRIRDEFGFQPVGDLRQSLAALAESDGEEWIRKILLYRFNRGDGLKGHNLGNLILTALQDMTGDTTKALEIAERVFRLEGRVVPVTDEDVNLLIKYEDGTEAIGEHILDERTEKPKKIKEIALTPPAKISSLAQQAIQEADVIIIGPGDYYASIMAVLAVDGVKEAFQRTKAHLIYILNLMTRLTQTPDMTAQDHVDGIEQMIQRQVDTVLVNNESIPAQTLELYQREKEFPVVDNLGEDPRVLRASIISDTLVQAPAYDTAHRSLLRHDSEKLQEVFSQLLKKIQSQTTK
jgi:uncharacterized cofD-like protein